MLYTYRPITLFLSLLSLLLRFVLTWCANVAFPYIFVSLILLVYTTSLNVKNFFRSGLLIAKHILSTQYQHNSYAHSTLVSNRFYLLAILPRCNSTYLRIARFLEQLLWVACHDRSSQELPTACVHATAARIRDRLNDRRCTSCINIIMCSPKDSDYCESAGSMFRSCLLIEHLIGWNLSGYTTAIGRTTQYK